MNVLFKVENLPAVFTKKRSSSICKAIIYIFICDKAVWKYLFHNFFKPLSSPQHVINKWKQFGIHIFHL